MAGTALAKSKTIVPGEAEDPETYFGFVRLFVLCRAGDGAISVQRVAEDLAHRGLVVGTRSVAQLVRGLERKGCLAPDESGSGQQRHKVYCATEQGRLAIEHAQGKLRRLLTTLGDKPRQRPRPAA